MSTVDLLTDSSMAYNASAVFFDGANQAEWMMRATAEMTTNNNSVTPSDWCKGIALSILASIIGGASKLAIRKSWLIQQRIQQTLRHRPLEDTRIIANREEQRRTRHVNTTLYNTLNLRDQEQFHEQDDFALGEGSEDFAVDGDNEENPPLVQAFSIAASASSDENNSYHVDDYYCYNSDSSNGSNDPEATSTIPLQGRERLSISTQPSLWVAYLLRFSGMIGMTFLNPLCGVLAMNYASPSILAPFSGLTLVWIVLFSSSLINEKPTFTQVVAASLIVSGEVIVAVFGDHTNDEHVTIQHVRNSYMEPTFLLYFIALTFWMLLLFYWMRSSNSSVVLKRFAWGVSGGSVTGLQNFLKDSLTILKDVHAPSSSPSLTLTGQLYETNVSYPWFFFAFVTLAIASSFGGLLLLTACMKRYDATYSSAMFVGSFVISASIMSAIHYDTFQHLRSTINFVMYPAGLVVLMVGVYILVNESKDVDDGAGQFQAIEQEDPLGIEQQPGSLRLDEEEQTMVDDR